MTEITKNSVEEDIPFYKRSEYWKSPYALLLIIGYVIYGISFALLHILKWIVFSWIRPFSNSKFLCKIGMHKYRFHSYIHGGYEILYKCKICDKKMTRDIGD